MPVDGDAPDVDRATVEGFGREWSAFDQSQLSWDEAKELFDRYFELFPWDDLPPDPVGFDAGCGSGRWARFVAPRVGTLHLIDASAEALAVAKRNLRDASNVEFHHACLQTMPLDESSMDFGYSLGVLHHLPDTVAGIRACISRLKPGAPLLLYLYYAFDDRPRWFRALWRVSDLLRRGISQLPFSAKRVVCFFIACAIYWPLARSARVLEKLGKDPEQVPLSLYQNRSFYTMRTDALDRFGTRLERRFTKAEIAAMLAASGAEGIIFAEGPPYWRVLARRAAAGG